MIFGISHSLLLLSIREFGGDKLNLNIVLKQELGELYHPTFHPLLIGYRTKFSISFKNKTK